MSADDYLTSFLGDTASLGNVVAPYDLAANLSHGGVSFEPQSGTTTTQPSSGTASSNASGSTTGADSTGTSTVSTSGVINNIEPTADLISWLKSVVAQVAFILLGLILVAAALWMITRQP